MLSKPAQITIIALILIFLATGTGIYFYRDFIDKKVSGIEELAEIPSPDLNRSIVITTKLSKENEEKAREYIVASQKVLKDDPDIHDEWMNLALYRKVIGDYEGAREIWEYVTKIRPSSGTAYHNLGNLYAYELQEPDKSEPYYIKAIEVEGSSIQFYVAAYEYYRFIKKDLIKARDILKKGITANPSESQGLSKILSSF